MSLKLNCVNDYSIQVIKVTRICEWSYAEVIRGLWWLRIISNFERISDGVGFIRHLFLWLIYRRSKLHSFERSQRIFGKHSLESRSQAKPLWFLLNLYPFEQHPISTRHFYHAIFLRLQWFDDHCRSLGSRNKCELIVRLIVLKSCNGHAPSLSWHKTFLLASYMVWTSRCFQGRNNKSRYLFFLQNGLAFLHFQ